MLRNLRIEPVKPNYAYVQFAKPNRNSCLSVVRYLAIAAQYIWSMEFIKAAVHFEMQLSVFPQWNAFCVPFLPRDTLQCKVRSRYHLSSVRLSVCLSVTLVDHDHIVFESFWDSLTMPMDIFPKLFWCAFFLINSMNVLRKFEMRSFSCTWDNSNCSFGWELWTLI